MLDDISGLLDEAIIAHEAKDLNLAAIKYTKILEKDAQHPDANHNFAILTIELGREDNALPYLQTAIITNPYVAQYWVTFINTLTNTGRIDQAQSVLDQASAFGYEDEIFKQLQHNLDLKRHEFKPVVGIDPIDNLKPLKFNFNAKISNNPNPPEIRTQEIINLYNQGYLEKALLKASQMIREFPESAILYNIIATANKGLNNLDNAIAAYEKAISLQPDYAEAYNNMGIALQKKAMQKEAIKAYNNALKLKPDYAEAYNNMGNAFQSQGKLPEAIEAYKKAISIKPDYAEAYNNMGNAFKNRAELKRALKAFKIALTIKPTFFEAYWNLYGTSENIVDAKKWINKCLEINPHHLESKLAKIAMEIYEGKKSDFNFLLNSALRDHPTVRSFSWAFNLPKLPSLDFNRWALFDRMTDLSKKDRPFYEFGVWRAESFKYLIKTFGKGYGFDTFDGLPENWHKEKAGTYSSDGNIPKIKGGKFIVGNFEKTLPGFFKRNRPKASIINFDADLYSSTICALNFAKPVIDQHTILIFDEFLMNQNWEQDEYRALEEFCFKNKYSYEVLALSFFTKQVAVKIIGI